MGGRFMLAQRVLRRLFYGAPVTVRIDDFDGDLTVDLHLWEHMQSRIFWVDYYNREVVALLNRLISEGMVFVDIGANIGEITMVAAKRVGAGRVIAFEPVDRYADVLEANISNNELRNISVVRAGLSDKVGSFEIYDSCGQGTPDEVHRGLNSLYSGPGEAATQIVCVTMLDEYL